MVELSVRFDVVCKRLWFRFGMCLVSLHSGLGFCFVLFGTRELWLEACYICG
jgi:hypothetical protein